MTIRESLANRRTIPRLAAATIRHRPAAPGADSSLSSPSGAAGPSLAASGEFVFRHAPRSRCTDLVLDIRDEPSLVTRLFFRALGVWRRPGATWYDREPTRDPAAMAASRDRVLAWDIGQIVVTHGDALSLAAPAPLRAVLGR